MKKQNKLVTGQSLLIVCLLIIGLTGMATAETTNTVEELHAVDQCGGSQASESLGIIEFRFNDQGDMSNVIKLQNGLPNNNYKLYYFSKDIDGSCGFFAVGGGIIPTNQNGNAPAVLSSIPSTLLQSGTQIGILLVAPASATLPNNVDPGPGPFDNLVQSSLVIVP